MWVHGDGVKRGLPGAVRTLFLLGLVLGAPAHGALPDSLAHTVIVSVSQQGVQGLANNTFPDISNDGRWVTFESDAMNLVLGDTNGASDIFVRDTRANTTDRVSIGPLGEQANADSNDAAISGDGRVVAFSSWASNLILGDTNGSSDVFVHDRVSSTTRRVSVSSEGAPAMLSTVSRPSLSADGRLVAFVVGPGSLHADDRNGVTDAYVHDISTGVTTLLTPSGPGEQNGVSSPDLSADGRFITFATGRALVAEDTTRRQDVYRRDLITGETTLVSIAHDGTESNGVSLTPSISADGRYVSFESQAGNLVADGPRGEFQVFRRDLDAHQTVMVSVRPDGEPGTDFSIWSTVSADGSLVAFSSNASDLVAGDVSENVDIFVRDVGAGETQMVSVGSLGQQGLLAPNDFAVISGNGNAVAFHALSATIATVDQTPSMYDVFLRHL